MVVGFFCDVFVGPLVLFWLIYVKWLGILCQREIKVTKFESIVIISSILSNA